MINYSYKSVFARFFLDFIHMKDAMGYRTPKIEYIFKELDIFFSKETVNEPIITKQLIVKWRREKVNESERTLYDKWSIISQFSRYMGHLGYPCYVPPMPLKHFNQNSFIPYIFTHEQIQAIFDASDRLTMIYNNMDSKMFCVPAMLRLLYGTGLRIGEAISLTNGDVDFEEGTILLRKTKNQQQRIVIMTPSLKEVLRQYVSYKGKLPIRHTFDKDAPFFISPGGSPVSKCAFYGWYRKLLRACNIPFIGDNRGPRVHDIRHTFAVHSLMKLVKEGVDIYCALPILATYMGHKTLMGTERYVRLTQEMYPDIIHLEESVSSYVFPSIALMKRADENE